MTKRRSTLLSIILALFVGVLSTSTTADETFRIKKYIETKTAPTISTNVLTINLTNGGHFAVALNANITTLTISNPPPTGYAGSFTIAFTADGTLRTITWPGSVKWPGATAPTMTSTNGKIDVFSFLTYDGGSTWLAFNGGQNF